MGPRGRLLVTLAVAGALVVPVIADHDSFPLSTYPMYARTRSAEVEIVTARGMAGGEDVSLSIRTIADTDDPLIAQARLREAVRTESGSEAICEEIADRAGEQLASVRVVTERHDVVERAGGGDSLRAVTVHAECAVDDD